jgi:hypothetical protein
MARTSPHGYSTDKTPDVDYKLRFVFDYSDVDVTARKVRAEVTKMANEVYKLKKATKKSDSGFGIWIETTKPPEFVNEVMSALLPADSHQIQVALTKDAQAFGQMARDVMKKNVNRIDTGTMKREIRYKITKRNLKSLSIDVGWIRLWYKYFDYQERGTKSIRPMESLFKTRMETEPEFYKLYSKFTRTYVLSADKKGTLG